jgi:hypothetical protein
MPIARQAAGARKASAITLRGGRAGRGDNHGILAHRELDPPDRYPITGA